VKGILIFELRGKLWKVEILVVWVLFLRFGNEGLGNPPRVEI
jgi:hypothetical protein